MWRSGAGLAPQTDLVVVRYLPASARRCPMTDWTEPDRSEERWLQPWEDGEFTSSSDCLWGEGPEFWMAMDEVLGWFDLDGGHFTTDFFTPRARWVSDR